MKKLDDNLLFLDCSNQIIEAFAATYNHRSHGAVQSGKSELRIVCSQSLKHPQLCSLSGDGRPTLLVGILPGAVTLGPLQMRQRSVCFACLQYWTSVADWAPPEPPPSVLTKTSMVELALRLTAESLGEFELFRTIEGLEDSLSIVEAATGETTRHRIFSRADCPACGGTSRLDPGNLRVHCSAVTGIVKHFKCLESAVAGVFHARALFVSPPAERGTLRDLGAAWGRGMSAEQAANSCLGEALEAYSATYRGDEPIIKATLAEVAGAIDPSSLLLYSQDQYDTRDRANKILPERHAIPERFDPSRPVDWLPGKNLSDGKQAWLPAALCLLEYPFRKNEVRFAAASRAGCASGLCFSDALGGALLELVEHDAVALWWYNRIRRPGVRLESFESPSLIDISMALRALQRDLFLLDVTNDLGIPTYVAVSTVSGTQLLFGAAAHVSPRIAAEQAATEVCQRWLCSSIAQMPSDFSPWMESATLANQMYCVPLSQMNAPPEPGAWSAEKIVKLCVQRLNRAGLHPVAVDLSRPDVLPHVVRMAAPGLRSVYDRRAAGRLYDVPVQLGWLEKPNRERELNPISCVF